MAVCSNRQVAMLCRDMGSKILPTIMIMGLIVVDLVFNGTRTEENVESVVIHLEDGNVMFFLVSHRSKMIL